MGLGYQSLVRDLGQDLPVRLWTDSSAAIGICSRQGLGKLRHLDTHTLWVQHAVRAQRIDLRKIDGEQNPADVFTKHFSARDKLAHLVSLFGCAYVEGRSAIAPQTKQGAGGRATIGEAMAELQNPGDLNALEKVAVIPHLVHSDGELDVLYPSMSVPDEEDSNDLGDVEDSHDGILQRGLAEAEAIAQAAVVHGRRRRLPQDTEPVVGSSVSSQQHT